MLHCMPAIAERLEPDGVFEVVAIVIQSEPAADGQWRWFPPRRRWRPVARSVKRASPRHDFIRSLHPHLTVGGRRERVQSAPRLQVRGVHLCSPCSIDISCCIYVLGIFRIDARSLQDKIA